MNPTNLVLIVSLLVISSYRRNNHVHLTKKRDGSRKIVSIDSCAALHVSDFPFCD